MKLSDQEVTCAICQQKSNKSLLIGDKAACFNCIESIINYICQIKSPLLIKQEEDFIKDDIDVLTYIGECQHDHKIGGWEAA